MVKQSGHVSLKFLDSSHGITATSVGGVDLDDLGAVIATCSVCSAIMRSVICACSTVFATFFPKGGTST